MVLGKKTLRDRSLLRDAEERSYREASYDLTIGTLVDPSGKLVEEYLVPPQGLVKVVSRETVVMPPNLIGYVLVKTSLCNEGVLALNIGIVDPGFEGPLSSALINFGKTSHRLRKGDVFSRLSVHELDEGQILEKATPISQEIAQRSAIDQVDRFLPATFLDIVATSERAAEEAFGNYKKWMFWAIPLLAVALTVMTFLLNFGNMWLLQSYSKPQDQVRTELLKAELETQLSALTNQTKSLKTEVSRLQADLGALKKKRESQRQ